MSDKCLKKVIYRDCQKESYDELTELEAQFRNAYMMKALEAQIAEKNADRSACLARENLSAKLSSLEDQKFIQLDLDKNIKATKEREMYKQVLEDQILLKTKEREYYKEESRKERKILEEVDKIMDEEHERLKKNNREMTAERLRRERLIFEGIRCIKKSIDKEKEEIASEKNKIYMEEVERRSKKAQIFQEEQKRHRQEVIEKVAKLFVNGEHLRNERNDLIADIVAEEIKYEVMIEEKKQKLRAKEMKEKLAMDLIDQMRLTLESEEVYRERDQTFVKEIMIKVMEDERMEKLTAEARKRKQLDYRRDLELLIDEKRKIREKSFAELKEELRKNKEYEKTREEIIKEEKRQLILKHSENISKYLKKGLLSEKEEEDIFIRSSANKNI